MREIFQATLRAMENGEPVAIATIIQGDTRWSVGAKMLVRFDGSTLGNFGDDRLAALALPAARRALNAGHAQRLAYKERAGAFVDASPLEFPDLEIFIQVFQPPPTLLLIGAGHIGEALVQFAKMVRWRVIVVDDRPDFITQTRLPLANERILVRYEPTSETLDSMPITITPSTFIVVATWGWDQPALRQIANSNAAYIGLVSSARKGIIIFRELIREGISADALARVHVPIGLDLGGETHTEIALSIMAEMLMVARSGTGTPLMQSKGSVVMKQATRGDKFN